MTEDAQVRTREALPHPVLGCFCPEGRVTSLDGTTVTWMPPRHDCAYIRTRNVWLAREAQEKKAAARAAAHEKGKKS